MHIRPGRRAAALAAIGAASLVLAACSDSGADSGSGEESTEFTYWSMWKEGEPMQVVMAQAIEDFEAETGITVDAQWQGRDNVQRTVPTLSTRTGPDLVDGSYVKLFPAIVASGQALGLDEAWTAESEGGTLEEVVPARYLETIDIELEDGQPWMVPYTITSDAVWFDAASHPDLVESPPQTWDDFIGLLDSLEADGQTPIALDGDIPGYNAYWFTTLLLRNSGPGSLHAIAADETGESWKDPAVLDAAEKVQQLVDGGYFVDGYDASKFPTHQQEWAAGDAALLFMGTWAPMETQTYASEGFDFASMPFPLTSGDHNSARADFNGFVVPRNADNADAAQKFAAFYLQEKYQALAAEGGQLPVREDVEPPAEQAGVWAHLQEADSFHQQNDGVAFPGYNDKVFWAINDELVLGKIDAQEFVDKMAAATAEYWAEQG
ncbi:extracellular solute-binding protein [Georgenia subflava]|uniref:Extracellular solute-binding protein n=2 Tax=Georgenia subflava TaxID=1622177 RepID=A0A6N7EJ10_9MICO|nr:extracellular solute-binding protein [Georgenia subflava]